MAAVVRCGSVMVASTWLVHVHDPADVATGVFPLQACSTAGTAICSDRTPSVDNCELETGMMHSMRKVAHGIAGSDHQDIDGLADSPTRAGSHSKEGLGAGDEAPTGGSYLVLRHGGVPPVDGMHPPAETTACRRAHLDIVVREWQQLWQTNVTVNIEWWNTENGFAYNICMIHTGRLAL
jgi:hypothetical protein